jgi:hypothetical protein
LPVERIPLRTRFLVGGVIQASGKLKRKGSSSKNNSYDFAMSFGDLILAKPEERVAGVQGKNSRKREFGCAPEGNRECELVSCPQGRNDQVPGMFLLVSFVLLVKKGERTVRGSRGTCKFGGQRMVGA